MFGKQIGQTDELTQCMSIPSLKIFVVIDNFDLHRFQFNIDFVILGNLLCLKFSQQPRHRFAYQWLDNVKINMSNNTMV